MRRTVNVKAVLVLLLSVICLGVGTHLVHGFQVKRNAHEVIAQSLQWEQEGQLHRATEALSLYLGLVPGDSDASARYGLLLDKLATTARQRLQAFLILEEVLRHDGQRQDIRRHVARMALAARRFADAKENLDVLLKANPDDAELMKLRGQCELATGHADLASAWFTKSLKATPNQIDLCLDHASLLRDRLQQPEAADQLIEQMLVLNERSLPARLAAARYFQRHGQWEKAEQHVRFALTELAAGDAETLLLAAELASARNRTEDARKYLELGLKRFPEDTRMSRRLARLEIKSGQDEKAKAYLKSSATSLPQKPEELWDLASMWLDLGELDKAAQLVKPLSARGPNWAADCVQARLLMRQQAWGKAIEVLEAAGSHGLPPGELNSRVNALLAECYERLENTDQQLNAWRRAVESDPRWLRARHGRAAALVAVGKLEEAIKEYRLLVAQTPELGVEFAHVLLAWNLRLPDAQRNWSEVEKVLKELPAERRQAVDVQLLSARLLVARRQWDEARKVLSTARARDPKQVGPWLYLAGLAEKQGQRQAILPLLEDAERQAGKRVEWHLARAEYWLKADPAEARKQLPKLEADAAQFPDAERNRLSAGLADAYAAVGDRAAAERLWGRLAERQPHNLQVRLLLLEGALQTGRDADLQRLVREIKGIEGENGAFGAYGEAASKALRARQGDKKALADAHVQLAKAERLRPSWSRPPLLAAELYEWENRKEKAAEKYLAALERGEHRLVVFQKALRLLYEQGRYAEATAVLHKLPQQALAVPNLGRIAAQLSLVSPEGDDGEEPARKQERALELARRSVADNSKDHRDYLWLGQVCALAGRHDEAEKAFRRARELAPTVPETWVTLIGFLARTDRAKAEALMTEAGRTLAKDQLPLVLAPGYEALGRLEQAEQSYRTALLARSNDAMLLRQLASFYARTGQTTKAMPVLRQLLDPQTGAAESTVVWARRYLAMALAVGGRGEPFQEALALLDENQKHRETTVEDQRAKAMVLATQPERRREAISLFESSGAHSPSMPPDARFVLAQLYEAEGNWPKAHAHMQGLLKDQPKNPLYLARYVRSLLRQGDVEGAGAWVETLAEVAPQTFETVELKARVSLAKGQPQEAVSVLTAYAGRKDAKRDAVALLLDHCGKTAEAEKLYRAHIAASKQPESVLLLAEFLGRHQRVAEALQICEQAWQTCRPEAVAAVSVRVVSAGHGSEQEQQRVERWLTAAITRHPAATTLPVMLASLYEFRGRYEDAVALYRKTLEHDKHNVLALNNLAYLLAWKEGKNAEARELIQTAINLAGPNPNLLDTRAVVSLMNDQPEPAIKDLHAAVTESPSATEYFHLAPIPFKRSCAKRSLLS